MSVTLSAKRPAVRRRRPLTALALAVGLAAIVTWDGAKHRTLPPSEGTQLNGVLAKSVPKPTLRIASFNIHGCRDAQGDFDFERTARALEGYDLIGLNEVHGNWDWQGPDQ